MDRIERSAAHAALDAMTQNGDADTIERAKVLIDCLPPARFTREDVEKACRAMCKDGGFDPDEKMPNDGPRWRYYVQGMTAALSAIGDVDHG